MLHRAREVARVLVRGTDVAPAQSPQDMGEAFHRLRERVAPFTMTSTERMYALHEAVRYVSRAAIAGDIVECGVWRGGSSMLAALTLMELDDLRTLWLYDTFAGMTEPGEEDRKWSGESAADELAGNAREAGAFNTWAFATADDVRSNMAATGFPSDRICYVVGKVEDTIPAQLPDRIALLRLDTDWYESTRHELEHLWPLLAPGGVLIIDDYGHWQGARQAVDDFFAETPVLLHRIDYTGRMLVKCSTPAAS
ncbi:MAG TPA: TylF/MycF/NovP-related O-methyltransferase [Solirubrobacteraceae bacterium]|jgi:hypothetical protein|nr:TylF/MycF/NovP-related O-methyltransferase [Solirubrobacteraceae bacterium]